MSNASGAGVRAAAAKAVHAVVENGHSLDAELRALEEDIRAEDRALLRNLAFGTIRHHFRLREWLGTLLDRRPRRRDRIVESLLAVGLFQLTGTRIPPHAVVSATVDAARALRQKAYAGLINAVLRRFIREDMANGKPATDESRYNHPDWMIRRLAADWPDSYPKILEAGNERAPMWLRVNTRAVSVAEYLGELTAAHLDFAIVPGLPEAVLLTEPVAATALPGFQAGHVSVQDSAAQIPAGWLLAEGTGRILDACAAPGGKTAHLLELGGDAIELDAVDIDAERLTSVADNLGRLGLEARLYAAAADATDDWWDGRQYARILLDAPCSASGVIRRHPDIKLLRRDSDIRALSATQAGLLDALWPLLEPGGMLLYVTCSVFTAENEAVVAAFLERTDDARPSSLLPNNNIRALMQPRGPGFQVLPGTRGMDGFYYAGLAKAR
jgi:16S rRNA (cytosine967-C5)-methyltransferase